MTAIATLAPHDVEASNIRPSYAAALADGDFVRIDLLGRRLGTQIDSDVRSVKRLVALHVDLLKTKARTLQKCLDTAGKMLNDHQVETRRMFEPRRVTEAELAAVVSRAQADVNKRAGQEKQVAQLSTSKIIAAAVKLVEAKG